MKTLSRIFPLALALLQACAMHRNASSQTLGGGSSSSSATTTFQCSSTDLPNGQKLALEGYEVLAADNTPSGHHLVSRNVDIKYYRDGQIREWQLQLGGSDYVYEGVDTVTGQTLVTVSSVFEHDFTAELIVQNSVQDDIAGQVKLQCTRLGNAQPETLADFPITCHGVSGVDGVFAMKLRNGPDDSTFEGLYSMKFGTGAAVKHNIHLAQPVVMQKRLATEDDTIRFVPLGGREYELISKNSSLPSVSSVSCEGLNF